MNVTNNFFIVNGQASRDKRSMSDTEIFELNYTSTIYPLDFYGNPIIIGNSL